MTGIYVQIKQMVGDEAFGLDVDLELPATGISVIYGASGSGKTTLLRHMAGLEKNGADNIKINDDVWQDANTFVPTHKRRLGYIFQDSGLFSHLDVRGNLAYAQKRATKGDEIVEFEQVVELMGIGGLLGRFPAQLSGGESQRVAMARALLSNPQLLLMDEPLAALDHNRRQEILPFLERLRDEFSLPIVYVTHSIDEVTRLADHLVILADGNVVAQGALAEILPRIDLPLKLGNETCVVIEGEITKFDSEWHLACATFDGGDLWIAATADEIGKTVRIRILARDVSLSLQPNDTGNSILNSLAAEIMAIVVDEHPAMYLVQIKMGVHLVLAKLTAKSVHQLGLKVGDRVWANVKSVSVTS